jgi:hypothetical protein
LIFVHQGQGKFCRGVFVFSPYAETNTFIGVFDIPSLKMNRAKIGKAKPAVEARIRQLRARGDGILKIGKKLGIGTSVVQRSLARWARGSQHFISPPSCLPWQPGLISTRLNFASGASGRAHYRI